MTETQCVVEEVVPVTVTEETPSLEPKVSARVQKGRDLLLTDPHDGTIVAMEDKALRKHLALASRLLERQSRRHAPKPPGYRAKTERSALRKFESAWLDLTYLQAKDLLTVEGEQALRWVVEHTDVSTD